tara:strand:+ start:16207 stop:19158 length:2952 start_codon:yes stop_codon:yes gene_type:complete
MKSVAKAVRALLTILLVSLTPEPSLAKELILPGLENCNLGAASLSSDGALRLALIVGIDEYRSVDGLQGAVNDSNKITTLIKGEGAGQFPAANICHLTNQQATYLNFKTAFKKSLVDRAMTADRRPADQVLIFFAGHGSQMRDRNHDEPDGWDETLVLFDSRSQERLGSKRKIPDLSDDVFNAMLSDLYTVTPNLVVILDSCHSGSVTRNIDSNMRRRFIPASSDDIVSGDTVLESDRVGSLSDGVFGFSEFSPSDFPNAVILSAASDDQVAVEVGRAGVFTAALIDVLNSRTSERLTYEQLFQQVRARLAISYSQSPSISGAASQFVFSNEAPFQPELEWIVQGVEPTTVTLTGLPAPGLGIGSELLVIPASTTSDQVALGDIATARIRVTSLLSGNIARATIVERMSEQLPAIGDYSVLVKPSAQSQAVTIKILAEPEPEGFRNSEATEIKLLQEIAGALPSTQKALIKIATDESADFLLAKTPANTIELRDANGNIRNVYFLDDADESHLLRNVAFDLSNHLRQKILLNGWTQTVGRLRPNDSLEVWLEPLQLRPGQGVCRDEYRTLSWIQAPPNQLQEIPLCSAYKIMVKLSDDAHVPLNVVGSVLSSSGRLDRLPVEEQRATMLWKKEDGRGMETTLGVFQAGPDSLDLEEYIYVLGLPLDLPVPWHLLSASTRQAPLDLSGSEGREYGTFSVLPVRTIANRGDDDTESLGSETGREYTLNDFDITPYLPDAGRQSSLYRVLTVADRLVQYESTKDGVEYSQHDWCGKSEEENLNRGIDCSRSIWYAFTRAGVPYNRHDAQATSSVCTPGYDPTIDGYLYTGDMARKDYLMTDEFVDCLSDEGSGGDFEIGDVLVYRDAVRGDGHTVMVVDPEKRIAWGSHGWDGNPNLPNSSKVGTLKADVGVEYQKIKIKRDWEKWDRSTMKLAACWRHKSFIEEAILASYRPGLAAICKKSLKPDTSYFRSSICSRLVAPTTASE